MLDRLAHGRVRAWIDALARRGLRMEVDWKPGHTVIRLGGRLDRNSAPVLKDGFQTIMPFTSKAIYVDLSGVDRVDGMGLAALVWAWHLARESDEELRLTRLRPGVWEIVAKMNLHHLLHVVEDRETLLLAE